MIYIWGSEETPLLLEDSDITLWSSHFSLKRFLEKNTLNAEADNWAIEFRTYQIKFKFIKSSKTYLQTLSCSLSIMNWGTILYVLPAATNLPKDVCNVDSYSGSKEVMIQLEI